MPAPGKKWRHVIINTRCSWLHGDERGFRSRRHRIHSSGDYRNPPPEGEHDGLLRYRLAQARPEIHVLSGLRPIVGRALVHHLSRSGHRILVAAVTKVHAHMLVELPDNIISIKQIIGGAKRCASRAVKSRLPGQIWARGGTFKPIKSRQHQRAAYNYILYGQGAGAWTWCFRDQTNDGQFRRPRP